MAMAGKADLAMKPKPVLIELRQLGQGVEAAIVIKAGQGTPSFEPAADGAERSVECFHEFGQGDHFFSPPAPEQRGGRVLDRFHGEERVSVGGTVYDYFLKRHILCQMAPNFNKEKPIFSRKSKAPIHPHGISRRHILGHHSLKLILTD